MEDSQAFLKWARMRWEFQAEETVCAKARKWGHEGRGAKGDTLGLTGAKTSKWKVGKAETWWRRALCAPLRSSEGDRESPKAFKGDWGNDVLIFLFQQDTLVLLKVDC